MISPSPASSKTSASQKWILLVEDHDPNILVATCYLENLGYSYVVARNGQEAVEKYSRLPFIAILMDIQMPEMDGYEAARQIREFEDQNGRSHTPIIAITSHVRREDREKCLRLGMDEYISKPFKPTDLKQKIEMVTAKPD